MIKVFIHQGGMKMAWIKLVIDACSVGLYSFITAYLLKNAKEINQTKVKKKQKNRN